MSNTIVLHVAPYQSSEGEFFVLQEPGVNVFLRTLRDGQFDKTVAETAALRWNVHNDLLHALKALANTADNADEDFEEYRHALRYAVQQARAAIAKAEGRP